MNDPDSREQISAFVDGELDGLARDRVTEALYGSNELRRAWERFHLIGDAMRKAGPVPGAESMSEKVGAALSAERVVPERPGSRRSLRAPLPGLALAASVAAVAILGIRSLEDGRGGQSASMLGESRQKAEVASPGPSVPMTPAPRIASTTQRVPPELIRVQWSDVAPDAEARLNAYLVNHNEHAGHGVRGVLPYVRIVGYQPAAGDRR